MKLLLALSGGIDSMYMAKRALDGALFPYDFTFCAAHCNFALRGEESDADESFVRQWCENNGIEFFTAHFDTANYAAEHGISIEMAARELRYDWFADLCTEYGFDATVVAHNADDNAETMLLNMLRGCGSRGMRGMSPDSGAFPRRILRPLLKTSREEITSFMTSQGLGWREDRTNAELLYKRNLLRHKVLPVFKEINPSFLKTLSSDMSHIEQVDEIANDYYLEHRTSDTAQLLSLKHWRYVLYRELEKYGFGEGVYNDMCELLSSGKPLSGKLFLSPTHRLDLSSGEMVFSPLDERRDENPRVMVAAEGTYELAGRKFSIRKESRPHSLRAPEGVLYIKSDAFPFFLRKWQEGDYITPLGLNGKKKKLSDMFVDLKIPAFRKDSEVVIGSGPEDSEVLALLCRRISEKLKVNPEDDGIIVIREEIS